MLEKASRRRVSPYPAAYREFIRLFNEEKFWEAHEVLEGPWLGNRSEFYKGIIIYASAFVHVQRGNPAGVRKQMMKVLRYLRPYRPSYLGLDVDRILESARAGIEAAAALEEEAGADPGVGGRLSARLHAAVPFPKLEPQARHRRGDEPELAGEGV